MDAVEGCVFCEIVAGKRNADLVYADPDGMVVVFKDAQPKAPVHLLIIPVGHYECLHDAPWEFLSNCMRVIARIVRAYAVGEFGRQHGHNDKTLSETGYRIVSNNGPDAHQTVKHLHFHLLGGHLLGQSAH